MQVNGVVTVTGMYNIALPAVVDRPIISIAAGMGKYYRNEFHFS